MWGVKYSAIVKEDTTLMNAILVRQMVIVCLCRQATGDPLKIVLKGVWFGDINLSKTCSWGLYCYKNCASAYARWIMTRQRRKVNEIWRLADPP